MFEYWQQVIDRLDIDASLLAPQSKESVIPYLSEKVDNKILVDIIADIENIEIYQDKNSNNNPDYIFEDKFIIKDDACYFVNPLNSILIQIAYEEAQANKLSFNKRGIVAINNSHFEKQKQQNTLTNEHESKRFFNKLINIAISHNATDIHIAPRGDESIYFRYRIDGILVADLVGDIDTKSYMNLANQIIHHAGGDPGTFNVILAKKFIIKDDNINATFRVSMLPTEFLFSNKSFVPRFVIRVHNNNTKIKNLANLGLNQHNYQKLLDVIKLNQGLVLVTGPTGSGKTTLLYAILDSINKERVGVSIQTAEDPVEKILPLIDQCSINETANITYQRVLEAFLRQDPDVGLIGEVRNSETAERVIDMAMTGHTAFTTLHTNTSLAAINRLRRLGVDERDVADVLKYTIASRLVRKVCPHCSTEQKIDIKKYQKIAPNGVKKITANTKGEGCDKCYWSGYSGRILLIEVLPIDSIVQTMIIDKRSLAEIEHYLIDNGEQVLWHNALEVLEQGLTTLDELERVLPPFNK